MTAYEVNFDGLIGPSHNYGGLSDGNLASAANAGAISNPRTAALQGLEKMRGLVRKGLAQAVFPPLERPNFDLLIAAGFEGTDAEIIEATAKDAPAVLKAAYSASSMWSANAATVSPSVDTRDGRLQITPANLSTMLHRSIECPDTTAMLISIFHNDEYFAVRTALPMHPEFSDEGAANHVRLCAEHGDAGVELFVYGRSDTESHGSFPARQSLSASRAIARGHGLSVDRTVFAKQSPRAIDAGAFHNDVVCVGALDTLFYHEHAFENSDEVIAEIKTASRGLFEPVFIMVPQQSVSLEDAIQSYLFNSQLLSLPDDDRLTLLAPVECSENDAVRKYCESLPAMNGPIGHVEFVDVRDSMRNGGGPACLRLRVVMTEDEIDACHQGVFMDEEAIDELQAVVSKMYRDSLSPADLADPVFAVECRAAREAILDVLDLSVLA